MKDQGRGKNQDPITPTPTAVESPGRYFKNTDHAQRGSGIINLEMEHGHLYFLISPEVMLTL